jgi:hypothetical protein
MTPKDCLKHWMFANICDSDELFAEDSCDWWLSTMSWEIVPGGTKRYYQSISLISVNFGNWYKFSDWLTIEICKSDWSAYFKKNWTRKEKTYIDKDPDSILLPAGGWWTLMLVWIQLLIQLFPRLNECQNEQNYFRDHVILTSKNDDVARLNSPYNPTKFQRWRGDIFFNCAVQDSESVSTTLYDVL